MRRSFSMAPTAIQREALLAVFPGAASGGMSWLAGCERSLTAFEEEQKELLDAVRSEFPPRALGRDRVAGEVCRELLAHLAGMGLAGRFTAGGAVH
jgi:hypothetical protein